jgi:hypothetical protein
MTTVLRRVRKCVVCALAFGLLFPGALAAQRVHNEFLETPTTRLELIGLKRWTLAMIEDSLARYAPGDSLTSHACAAILRYKLKFADAAVQYVPPGSSGHRKGYFAVPLVEPQDSARVRYRRAPSDSLANRQEWQKAQLVFQKRNMAFQSAVQDPSFVLGHVRPSSANPEHIDARPLFDFMRAHRDANSRRLALWTLSHDRNQDNRAIAAVLLGNFAASDTTWWALVDALRDANGIVSSTASQVLTALARGAARRVNWRPAADTLRALLDGTDLFAQNTVFEVLSATKVDRSLAPTLLHGGGELVLAKLASEDPVGSTLARRFLDQLSGRDYGHDVEQWQRWLDRIGD